MSTTSAMPAVGDVAPDFTVPSNTGRDISLSDYRGKQQVVLYFYPHDMTAGCTKEACAFRDLRAEFQARGAEILGVSTDTLKSHDKFTQKHGLNFPLLADTDHALAEKYGAWGPKKFMGREFVGTIRSTFVIDRDGRIKAVFPRVKVEGHVDKVLAALD